MDNDESTTGTSHSGARPATLQPSANGLVRDDCRAPDHYRAHLRIAVPDAAYVLGEDWPGLGRLGWQ